MFKRLVNHPVAVTKGESNRVVVECAERTTPESPEFPCWSTLPASTGKTLIRPCDVLAACCQTRSSSSPSRINAVSSLRESERGCPKNGAILRSSALAGFSSIVSTAKLLVPIDTYDEAAREQTSGELCVERHMVMLFAWLLNSSSIPIISLPNRAWRSG